MVPCEVSGIREFLSNCERSLPLTALQGARLGYDVMQRPFPVFKSDLGR